MARRFLYTITTGRSGTVFLYSLLEKNLDDATVFHERFGYPHFGRTCPDASHGTAFNSVGNIPLVENFWKEKLAFDAQCESSSFVEVSHVLAKAGLVENLGFLPEDSEIHLVGLKRDPFKIFWSYVNRFDFINPGFTWLFSLDPRYPNVIINSDPFREFGMMGSALWYVWEVFARIEYYRRLVEGRANVTFHEVELETVVEPDGAVAFLDAVLGEDPGAVEIPGKRNAMTRQFFGEKEKQSAMKLFERLHCDPVELGARFFESGCRLGTPQHLRR